MRFFLNTKVTVHNMSACESFNNTSVFGIRILRAMTLTLPGKLTVSVLRDTTRSVETAALLRPRGRIAFEIAVDGF